MLSDRDYDPNGTLPNRLAAILTLDLDNDNTEGETNVAGEVTRASTYNFRNHRSDTFSFFARDLFPRQTGNDGTLVADMTSNEAWIWYGHLQLPNGSGGFTTNTLPGFGNITDNPNNFTASQWILGRMAVLLKEPDQDGYIETADGTQHWFAFRDTTKDDPGYAPNINQVFRGEEMSPLWYGAGFSGRIGNASVGTLNNGRYDLAGTSVDAFKRTVDGIYQALEDELQNRRSGGNPTSPAPPEPAWWMYMFHEDSTPGSAGNPRPFRANPFVVKPVTAQTYSQQAPVMLPGCTQFIVEYAGDFLDQDNDANSQTFGQVENVCFELPWQLDPPGAPPASPFPSNYIQPDTDDAIDFIVDWVDADNDGVIDPGERPTMRQRIRWYGLPRDTDGDTNIWGGASNLARRNVNLLKDVLPLRDVAFTGAVNTLSQPQIRTPLAALQNAGASFEKIGPRRIASPFRESLTTIKTSSTDGQSRAPTLRMLDNYAAPGGAGMQPSEYYTCVWTSADKKPLLFRIIIVIDDPNARLSDGKTFEYVFKVP
jgi:hypothetical protein